MAVVLAPAKLKQLTVLCEILRQSIQKWNGKVRLDEETLEQWIDKNELRSKIQIPWKAKGKSMYWNAVLVDPDSVGKKFNYFAVFCILYTTDTYTSLITGCGN